MAVLKSCSMAHRKGILAVVRRRVRRGRESAKTLAYLEALLLDPCPYCGEVGSDSLDHIIPWTRRDQLVTGYGSEHWTNLTGCHKKCNFKKRDKGLIYELVEFLSINFCDGTQGH
jgi:5-methylcytosine-specific restriction endonuclease McrA